MRHAHVRAFAILPDKRRDFTVTTPAARVRSGAEAPIEPGAKPSDGEVLGRALTRKLLARNAVIIQLGI